MADETRGDNDSTKKDVTGAAASDAEASSITPSEPARAEAAPDPSPAPDHTAEMPSVPAGTPTGAPTGPPAGPPTGPPAGPPPGPPRKPHRPQGGFARNRAVQLVAVGLLGAFLGGTFVACGAVAISVGQNRGHHVKYDSPRKGGMHERGPNVEERQLRKRLPEREFRQPGRPLPPPSPVPSPTR